MPNTHLSEATDCSDLMLAYLAGIMDGEGCIGIYTNSKRHRGFQLRVKVTMCEPAAVLLMRQVFGGSLRTRQMRKGGIRPYFEWTLSGKPALACLSRLGPFLILKAPQAQLAIEYNEVRLSMGHRCGQRPYSDDEFARLTSMKERLQSLKRVPGTLDS